MLMQIAQVVSGRGGWSAGSCAPA